MKFFLSIALISGAMFFAACENTTSGGNKPGNNPATPDVAATVNGKEIKTADIEKILKQQLQDQAGKLSELELAQARLQVLNGLIEQEVMFQKAVSEKTLPSDDEVLQEFNQRKQQSGLTADQFAKQLADANETEESLREVIKKALAIKKLGDRISSTVTPPTDADVEKFFNSSPEAFKKRRGASLKAIVIDPQDTGNGDTTRNEAEMQLRLKEIGQKLAQGSTFEALASEYSEDPQTKLRSGEWRDFSEDEMKQAFGQGFSDFVMTKATIGQTIPQAIPFQGKVLLLKVAAKQEKDEDQTLDSPSVKPQITDYLINSKKQLLTAAYQARVMDEARIENYLAKRVVDNPNELSGARPANSNPVASPSASTAASPAANSNTAVVTNSNAAANTNSAAPKR